MSAVETFTVPETVEVQKPGPVASGVVTTDDAGLFQRRDNYDIEEYELQSNLNNFSAASSEVGRRLTEPQPEQQLQFEFVDFPEGGRTAWSVVFGSWCAMTVTFGISNTTGFLQAYLTQHQLKNYSQSEASWIFSIYYFLCLFGGVQVGPIFDTYGLRFVLLPGCVGMVASLFLLSFCEKYWQFILSFGILGGISASMLFTPGIAVVSHWFYKKRGLATGIAASGGAVGGVVFPLSMAKMMNEIGYGWTIRVLAFMVLALCIGCFFTLRTRHPGLDEDSQPDGKRKKKVQGKSASIDITVFKDVLFSITTLGTFLIEFSYIIPMTYVTSYAISKGVSQTFSYQLLGILNAASIIGRSLPGFFADRWGRFNVMIVTSFFCALSNIAIWLPAGNNIAVMIVFVIMFGFWSGTAVCLTPVCISQICRTEDFGKRYGSAYMLVSLGALVGLPIAGSFLNKPRGYDNLIIFASVIYFLGSAFYLTARVYAVGWKISTVF